MFPWPPSVTRTVEPIMEAAGIEPAQDSPGYIYVVQGRHGGPVKVGWTATERGIADRLKSLQTGNPQPLTLVWSRPGSRSEEKDIHRTLHRFKLAGEWFEAVEEVASAFGAQPGNTFDELYERAFQEGWSRGYDDANATEAENADRDRNDVIELHDEAMRDLILTGSRRRLKALRRVAKARVRPSSLAAAASETTP